MRTIALLCAAACGGPALQNVPKPDPAPIAGAAAAAAAAMTLADPNAATRGKPEKSNAGQEKQPIEVKEHVPAAVLDRLDQGSAGPATDAGSGAPKSAKHKGPLPKLPSPKAAAETQSQHE
jgi:hypothetical protein